MNPERFQQVKDLVQRAMDLPLGKRAAFLDRECAGDTALRADVQKLVDQPTGDAPDVWSESAGAADRSEPGVETRTGAVASESPECLETAAPAQAPTGEQMDGVDRPGDRIGSYVLSRKLGEGGMGVVWEAEQTAPVKRTVALKLIKLGMDTRQVVARFESERQALALMNHPSIARVYDAGATGRGRPYFVMERVDGVPLTEYCDSRELGTTERLELFVRICGAVQHAHQKGVIHRDLKPSNVLVEEHDGKPLPKVIDFGIAKATDQRLTEATVFTQLGQMVGTPAYMSPEQADPTASDIDTRTDVYALGVLLYELLVGVLPFDPAALRMLGWEEILRNIREEEPPRPSRRLATLGGDSMHSAKKRGTEPRTLRRQLAGDLDWITMRALEKNRDRRYPTPSEFAADVERFLSDEPVVAGPPSGFYRAKKFTRRHRAAVGVSALVATMLVAFSVTTSVQALRIAREAATSKRVSEFLANALGTIKPDALGEILRHDLRERVQAAQVEQGRDDAQVAETLAAFDGIMGDVSTADAALRLLDEEILSRAGDTIEEELADEPEIAGRLEQVLGRTYGNLGLFDQAVDHARRAVELRRGSLGREHRDTLAAERTLAFALFWFGDRAAASELRRENYEVSRRVLGRYDLDTLASAVALADVYGREDRTEQAVEMLEEVLVIRRRELGPDDTATLGTINDLANQYSALGRFADAERMHGEVLVARRKRGDDVLTTERSAYNMAVAVQRQGRHADAETLLRESWENVRMALGEDHMATLWSMNALANSLQKQGRYQEAEALILEVREICERKYGGEHPFMRTAGLRLAEVYQQQRRYDDAATALNEVLDLQRKALGPRHRFTLGTMSSLGRLEAKQDHREAAFEWLRQAVDLGFSDVTLLETDPDLAVLREDPEFRGLIDGAKRNGGDEAG